MADDNTQPKAPAVNAVPYLEIREDGPPVEIAAGASFRAERNAAGKLCLLVQFKSGAVSVLATEP